MCICMCFARACAFVMATLSTAKCLYQSVSTEVHASVLLHCDASAQRNTLVVFGWRVRVGGIICDTRNCLCGGVTLALLRRKRYIRDRNVRVLGDACASKSEWDGRRRGTHGSGRLKPAHRQPAPWRGRIRRTVLSKRLSAEAARGPEITNDYIIFRQRGGKREGHVLNSSGTK